jgi:hypothetical protein
MSLLARLRYLLRGRPLPHRPDCILTALGALAIAERHHRATTHAIADAITALAGIDSLGLDAI